MTHTASRARPKLSPRPNPFDATRSMETDGVFSTLFRVTPFLASDETRGFVDVCINAKDGNGKIVATIVKALTPSQAQQLALHLLVVADEVRVSQEEVVQ